MPQNRRSQRSNVLLAATLDTGTAKLPVKLRNLSAEGALVQGIRLPASGGLVHFCRNELSVPSRVAWVHGDYAGIAFAEQLKPEEVLRNVPSPKARIPTSFRRPGLTCRELTEQEKAMLLRLG